jgi:hypothetical protein
MYEAQPNGVFSTRNRMNVVLTPTRGRPEKAAELIDCLNDTTARLDPIERTGLIFAVCLDDPRLDDYVKLAHRTTDRVPWTMRLFRTPYGGHKGFVHPLNLIAGSAEDALAYTVLGDDHRPRTQDWDTTLFGRLVGAPSFAYGDDRVHGEGLPTAVMMSTSVYGALRYIAPPVLGHLYVDNTWKAWGQGVDRLTYRPDVILEHLHPLVGKAEDDDTYRAQRPGVDQQTWVEYCQQPYRRELIDGGPAYRELSRIETDIDLLKGWR